jgi:hypothetical protein
MPQFAVLKDGVPVLTALPKFLVLADGRTTSNLVNAAPDRLSEFGFFVVEESKLDITEDYYVDGFDLVFDKKAKKVIKLARLLPKEVDAVKEAPVEKLTQILLGRSLITPEEAEQLFQVSESTPDFLKTGKVRQ